MPVKRLLILILVVAALWSGYWLIGAAYVRNGIETWFAEREADDWQADYGDFRVTGFPNRFDMIWTDLALADPRTGWALTLPEFAFMALSYNPLHMIAVAPNDMQLATPLTNVTITDSDLRASLKLRSRKRLEVVRSQLSGDDLLVTGPESVSLGHLNLAMEQAEDDRNTYRLGALAQDLTPPEALKGRIASGVALPEMMQEARLDATVTFSKPWDITAIEDSRPQPRHIQLDQLKAQWGELAIQATATLEVDEAGLPTGELALQAKNWQALLRLAVETGVLDERLAQGTEAALKLLSGMSGNPASLDVTVAFRDGRTFLGPIPVGPAPVIQLR
nr:DUF2125 domain-containing protein [Pseudooceanicola sp. HF7]